MCNEHNLVEGFVCVWSDGTWCYQDDVESYSFMSDDYVLLFISGYSETDIDEKIQSFLANNNFDSLKG